MSALSDKYIKNFSKERKDLFNKRFSDDYDPNMSELSNILRILAEMRELGLADGGRIGLREGLGSFETNDPKEAMKEVIKRFLEKNLETTTVPISENIFLNLGPGVSEVELGGIMKILGGELGFGASKDKGIGFNFKKEFNKGGRVAYQEGTDLVDFYTGGKYDTDDVVSKRQEYETPVTDAIKSVNEKTIDAIQKGKEGFERFTGVDQIESNFPGSYSSPIGAPSDFRHQAASNLVAQALGKGAYSDPILGPISYLSGGIGSFGLGTVKEIGDLVAGLLDKNTTAKEAFSQAYEDTISNFKGAFAPAGTTSEELYAELMKDYQPIRTGMFDPFGMDRDLLRSQQIFAQRKKALEDAQKKQKDKIITPIKKPTKTVTGTTKPGTGGGGGRQVDTSRGAVRGAQQDISNYQDFGEVPLSKGGLARMLGE
jgi:hypothetical protein